MRHVMAQKSDEVRWLLDARCYGLHCGRWQWPTLDALQSRVVPCLQWPLLEERLYLHCLEH